MIWKEFRTKERKIAAAVMLGITIIIILIFLYENYQENRKSDMQAVMAENYLKAGNYEQAVEAYTKALSMKNTDQQLLSAGLARAYIGMDDYDSALIALRSCYQKTHGNKVKEMIEEVTSKKTDYEYSQAVSRAEVYFSDEDYDKAIAEYEKAKLIKSKEATSFRRIAQAYIEKGEYELAREELLEGRELTKDDSLAMIFNEVEKKIIKGQYEDLIKQAAEYIYQENYTEGIAEYKRAVILLPEEGVAYQKLAEVYVLQKQYAKAIDTLQSAAKLTSDEAIESLLKETISLRSLDAERTIILNGIYNAMVNRDFVVCAAMLNRAYKNKILVRELPVYYNPESGSTEGEQVMIVYRKGKVYLGCVESEKKNGRGTLFIWTSKGQELEYCCYDGEWENDKSNGRGKMEEAKVFSDTNKGRYLRKTVFEEYYNDAWENEQDEPNSRLTCHE